MLLGIIGEKLLPDGDFSGYVERGNALTRRGFLFSNELGTMEFITKHKSWLDALMYSESASSERISLVNIA